MAQARIGPPSLTLASAALTRVASTPVSHRQVFPIAGLAATTLSRRATASWWRALYASTAGSVVSLTGPRAACIRLQTSQPCVPGCENHADSRVLPGLDCGMGRYGGTSAYGGLCSACPKGSWSDRGRAGTPEVCKPCPHGTFGSKPAGCCSWNPTEEDAVHPATHCLPW
jgi:hypothetical protein